MKLSTKIELIKCISFCQCVIILSILCTSSLSYSMGLKDLNPYAQIQDRMPATSVASEEPIIKPVEKRVILKGLFIEDDAGVLISVREGLLAWERQEEYARKWNLTSTGMYRIVGREEKKAFINRNILKYVDKRLSGEIKSAEEGSALQKVGTVQKALKPNTTVAISKTINVKFKARVLQGTAHMIIKNPVADYKAEVNMKGDVNMNLHRDLKSLGVNSNIDYNVKAGRWVASFDRPLTKKIKTRLSANQSDKEMAFSSASDKKLEFFFNHQF